jgi:hypothetical protein
MLPSCDCEPVSFAVLDVNLARYASVESPESRSTASRSSRSGPGPLQITVIALPLFDHLTLRLQPGRYYYSIGSTSRVTFSEWLRSTRMGS